MLYTIVKHAAESVWPTYYTGDPSQGVLPSHSCHKTHSALQIGVKESYTDLEEAQEDCRKLNVANPVGAYAVCPILFLT